jgi:sRNA-binding protein
MQRLSEEMMRMGFSHPNIERLVERARQSNQQASARVQEKMRQAQAKLEQKLAAAQRKAEAKSGRRPSEKVSFSFGGQPFPAPEKPAASEEERLLILKMLEEKKITIEEAEMLLNALEG